ncbi:MAG: hypothetical protein ACFFBD_25955 [Candidatus Hodarchaeota archaeon]
MAKRNYPQNPEEWQSAISNGIGLSGSEGQSRYQSRTFPYRQLEQWIQRTFSKGFSPNFVPALLRNIKGLVAWVYGGEEEPFWPGSDDENS